MIAVQPSLDDIANTHVQCEMQNGVLACGIEHKQPVSPEIYESSLQQLHLYGAYARASNAFLHAPNIDVCKDIVLSFCNELNLVGFIRLLEVNTCFPTIRFGEFAEKSIFREAAKIQSFMWADKKVKVEENCLLLNTDQLFFFCCTQGVEPSIVGALQDMLTLFADSLSSWLKNHAMKKQLDENLQTSLQKTIAGSEELIQKYMKVSDELAFGIVSKFPTLGLDADQETLILDILTHHSNKKIGMLEQEIERNAQLGDSLIKAVAQMDDIDLEGSRPVAMGVTSVELF